MNLSIVLKEYIGFIPDEKEVSAMAVMPNNKKTKQKKSPVKKTSKKPCKGC